MRDRPNDSRVGSKTTCVFGQTIRPRSSRCSRRNRIDPSWRIADIGSGPGNLSRLFLAFGATVNGVDPNEAMRNAGDELMTGFPNFTSVNGTAESTGLASNSIDLITAGQAFHWFEPGEARTEFQRILKYPGWVVLIWNKRPDGSSPILDEYSSMLNQFPKEYERVRVRDGAAADGMRVLFDSGAFREFRLPHEQILDAEGFWGRHLSSSYTPLPGDAGHDEIRVRSQEIFDHFSENGFLTFPYETQMFIGQVNENPPR